LAEPILISWAVATAILPRGWWPAALVIGASVVASEFYPSGQTVGRHILLGGFILCLSVARIGAAISLRLMMDSARQNGMRA
jgi:hypothetical protein